ncbi:phage virion morphogenesis protein [Streptomyces microflavus]|uniref:hypothetical protein n=1 Tax=Streptomyces microflavus TaxID=1919 RepID=UPI002E339B8B|nr:hypothetical protein [Streptomyces microflavus]
MEIDHAATEAHLGPAIDDLMMDLGKMIAADAKDFAPRKSGDLAESIRPEVNDGILRVGSDLARAEWMEEGTPAHVIRPKNAKALFWPGAEHPWALVNHPGTEPRPFLRPALWIKREAP